MKISPVEEFGLRCALQLAMQPKGAALPASEISKREGISLQYVSKIMHLLKRGGLVSASRGIQGGFRLSKSPEGISLKEILGALKERPQTSSFCNKFKGNRHSCANRNGCRVRLVWDLLAYHVESVLAGLTLSDLASDTASSREKVLAFARKHAERSMSEFERTSHASEREQLI